MRIGDWSSDVCSSDLLPWSIVSLSFWARSTTAAHRSIPFSTSSVTCRLPDSQAAQASHRPISEERRVGTACVSTLRSRLSPSHSKKNTHLTTRNIHYSSHNTPLQHINNT